MVKRLLNALEYPDVDSLNLKDENTYRKLIIWLENNRIQKANPEVHKQLNDISSQNWRKTFNKYKLFLGTPEDLTDDEEALQWILGLAIQEFYAKNQNIYNKYAVEDAKKVNIPQVVNENSLDKLDFTSKEFQDGINKVAKSLKVTSHPNPIVTLKAIRQLISARLTDHALKNPNEFIVKGTPFPLQDADLGINLSDPVLKQAAKILRLLYIQDLRNLQTKANELIAATQNVTANPKTDTRLGKVGF